MLAPVDRRTLVGNRRLRNVTFVRPLHAGDQVWVDVDVDRLRELSDELVMAETSCMVLNQRGETIAELRVDFLHRQTARPAPVTPATTIAHVDRDDADCVENIPV